MHKPNKNVASGFWRLDEERPWLTEGSVYFIAKYINRSHNVLEFGAGASTVFFARRSKRVISFESGGYSVRLQNVQRSADWFQKLRDKFNQLKLNNVELYLLQGYPKSAIVYAHVLKSLPDDHFHWVLIDGANRNLCIDKSRNKLVSGGYMIIDNYDHIPAAKLISSMAVFMKDVYCTDLIKDLLRDWKEFRFDEEGWPGLGTLIFRKP